MTQSGATIVRSVIVTIAIVILTSLSVDATDALRGSQSALGVFARFATEGACPEGMSPVTGETSSFCIDVYEAGVGESCPFPEPFSIADTASNATALGCAPLTVPAVTPWRFVSRVQAEQLCAKAGKRLPTPLEWYQASLGTIDSGASCNTISGQLSATGVHTACRSGVGAFDMIGNVWELTAGAVTDGKVGALVVPHSGYVIEVGTDGVATMTTSTPQHMFNDDYFWSEASGTYTIMRGGFYGGYTDAGLYSAQAAIAPSFASAAIGFRCVKSL